MKVHRYFGLGFPEIIYHRAMIIELIEAGISFESEAEKTVMYYDKAVGRRRIDMIVEEKVLIEFKAITELDSDCQSQVLNCLRVFNLEVGLLLNFGTPSLQIKRLALTRTN